MEKLQKKEEFKRELIEQAKRVYGHADFLDDEIIEEEWQKHKTKMDVYQEVNEGVHKLRTMTNPLNLPYEAIRGNCQEALSYICECIDAEFGEEALQDMKRIIEERLEAGRW